MVGRSVLSKSKVFIFFYSGWMNPCCCFYILIFELIIFSFKNVMYIVNNSDHNVLVYCGWIIMCSLAETRASASLCPHN